MERHPDPRCTACDTVLVHTGAICVVCNDADHYEAPIRTSPPLRLPDRSELGDVPDDLAPRALAR